MRDAVLVVPWRAGCPHRDAAWQYVRAHLPIRTLTADGAPGPFHRARSKNHGAAVAVRNLNPDVLIFHDADMLAPLDAYPQMIELAQTSGCLTVGFTRYLPLTPEGTAQVLEDGADPFTEAYTDGPGHDSFSLGGIVALTVEAWRTVGGYDERFTGWGLEDTAFAVACATLLGPTQRTRNVAVHLWHPHGTATEGMGEGNADLLDRYNVASKAGPDAMRALLAEEGGPLC